MKNRVFVALLLAAVLAIPAFAQQDNSSTQSQPAATQSQPATARCDLIAGHAARNPVG